MILITLSVEVVPKSDTIFSLIITKSEPVKEKERNLGKIERSVTLMSEKTRSLQHNQLSKGKGEQYPLYSEWGATIQDEANVATYVFRAPEMS